MDYRDFLARLAAAINCQSYFEVGVNKGRSLREITAASVGVDPKLRLEFDVAGNKPMVQLYQTTSDDFFARHNLTALFGRAVDLAFLDGMHRFEYLLNDFINTEPHTHAASVILLHDCFPVNAEMTERERNPRARRDQDLRRLWAGDVWKMIPILKKYRPDLSITCTNCYPTGLAIIQSPDPGSAVLREKYREIVAEYMDQTMTDANIGAYFEAHPFTAPETVLARF